jgi:hypothetical protein
MLDGHGYISVKLQSSDFFYPMVNKGGRVCEHRLIMAKHLGRCLHCWEIIHHRDGNKTNNNLDNLELTTLADHLLETKNGMKVAYNRGFEDGLKVRNDELKKEIRLLRWELRQTMWGKELEESNETSATG